MDVLAGIFAAALLQDLSYTAKTALVSRGHRTLAVAADVSAMLTSSLYLILTASVTMRSGLSIATVEAFAAIAIGGACGTIGGMFAVELLERRLALIAPKSEQLVHTLRSRGSQRGGGLALRANSRFPVDSYDQEVWQ